MLLKIVYIEILSNFVVYRYIEYAFLVPTQYNGLLVFPHPRPETTRNNILVGTSKQSVYFTSQN